MPCLSVRTCKRVIILHRQGYSLSEIRNRLDEVDIDISIRSLQRLFDRFHTVKNLPRVARPRLLTSEMLSTMNVLLKNDDELTARHLSDKLREEYANLPNISLSTRGIIPANTMMMSASGTIPANTTMIPASGTIPANMTMMSASGTIPANTTMAPACGTTPAGKFSGTVESDEISHFSESVTVTDTPPSSHLQMLLLATFVSVPHYSTLKCERVRHYI